MPNEWINFKELRRQLSFESILRFYDIEIKRKKGGRQHQGFCPLPTHKGSGRSPSFSADLEKGVWQCFGCHASGNALDFVCRMEGLSPNDPQAIRKTALLIQERGLAGSQDQPPPKRAPAAQKQEERVPEQSRSPGKVMVNVPLDFQLKGLDPHHPYLKNRGFFPETISHFGLGYCGRGLLKGRIAIPLYDSDRKLVGYAGRIADDAAINEENPRYKFPPPRERDGISYEFHKGLLLYLPPGFKGPVEDLIIVEGFPSVWWLWQWKYPAVAAVMGSTCSPEQARLIVDAVVPDGSVWVFTDGDEAGQDCAASILTQVSPHRFCRWVKLEKGQPTDCTPGDLAKLLWQV
jgi:DNA primase